MDPREPYLVGLLLALVILAAVPVFATGITWFAVLLLVMVWSYALRVKASGK